MRTKEQFEKEMVDFRLAIKIGRASCRERVCA